MARGWESKAIEDQIAASEDRKATPSKRARSADELQRESRRQGLLLSRAKIVTDIDHARDDRHRAALQQALEYLDNQLKSV